MKRAELLKELRQSTVKEISAKISSERKEFFILNQDKVLGKIKNVAQIKQRKRNLARMLTTLDEKITENIGK